MAFWAEGFWSSGFWTDNFWSGLSVSAGDIVHVTPPLGPGGTVAGRDRGSTARRSLSSGPAVYPFGKKSDRAKTLEERIAEVKREIGGLERQIAAKEAGRYYAGVEGEILHLWDRLGKLEDKLDKLEEQKTEEENKASLKILDDHFRDMH